MSKRVFVLILTLAAALVAADCAPKKLTSDATRSERRLDALDRYSFLEFRLRLIRYELASIDDEVAPIKEPGGDTAIVDIDPETISAEMGDTCEELAAAITAIEAEIKKLEEELERMKGDADAMTDGTVALARIAGLVDILTDIDDEVQSVKESGGEAGMELTSCDAALAELIRLQGVLSRLAERVEKLQADMAYSTTGAGS